MKKLLPSQTQLTNAIIRLFISLGIIFFTTGISNAGGDFNWEYESDYSTIMTPAVSNGKVYMPVSVKFMCLDASTGSSLWEYDLHNFTWASPAVSGDKVFFGGMNNATLYCLDATTGSLIWKYVDESNYGSWSSAPAVWGDYVYGGSPTKKKIICLNANDGSIIWEFQNNTQSSPAVSGGYVYTPGRNQDNEYIYYCLDGKTGSVLWESQQISPIGYTPAVNGSYLFVGGYKLTCLDALTGGKIWETDVGALESAPTVSGNNVYINASRKTYCFDAGTGEKIWEYESTSYLKYSRPVVTGNFVYTGARSPDKLICLNAWTGELVFEYETNDAVNTPSIDNGYVYFGIGDNGTGAISGVFCVGAADGDTGSWPMMSCNPERTNSLNGNSAGPTEIISILTSTEPNITVTEGYSALVYGTAGANHITLENKAMANLINFPGNNTITIQSNSNQFTIYRSGAYITFTGTDGTLLKMPATTTSQTIIFKDMTRSLIIKENSVMLGNQKIGLSLETIEP